MFKKILLSLLLFTAVLSATTPTQDSVTKLYVATFERAPDAKGLAYWIDDSGLTLEQIAMSFFDQKETQDKYPSGTDVRAFVETVYDNLFNREPDEKGWAYWTKELEEGSVSRSVFILAMINGALGDDAVILKHKMEVGLYFAKNGLDDAEDAISVMADITEDPATVVAAKKLIDEIVTPGSGNKPPVADAGVDQNSVATDATVTLDGSESSDPDEDTITYKWDLKTKPTGSSATLSSDTAIKPTFTADIKGTYTIELIVNDGTVDSEVDSVQVAVDIDNTDFFITTWKTDNEGVTDDNQIKISTHPTGYTYDYSIDWGDDQSDTGVTGDKTHTYSSAGTYSVKIS
ncbi:MAG: hypothetical protein DRG33_05435, partial [Deltaproteobacteria bacterium]